MNVRELFDLNGRIALVTGGAGHLGAAITSALAEAGAYVYFTTRSVEKRKDVMNSLHAKYDNLEHLEMDILSLKSIDRCKEMLTRKSEKIHILVNNASQNSPINDPFPSEQDWLSGLDESISGTYRVTKSMLPLIADRGSIINISSIYGSYSPVHTVYENNSHLPSPSYSAGKAAIMQFTRYYACFLAKKGIRVNSISPGAFPRLEYRQDKKFISKLSEKIPLGRIGDPDEIKGAIVFLASDASSFVTGANIFVDGGWTAW